MRLIIVLFFSLCITYAKQSKTPLAVEYVNPANFSGLWYEIARTYNSFEKNCVAATVEYKLEKNNNYSVTNRCFEHEIDGKLIVYNGTVQALEKDNMAKIKSTYFWIFSKNYQIIYLDDYQTAVMGDKNMENVWIMNREPFLDEKKLKDILAMLENYMDIQEFIFTKQDKNGKYK
ncbi:hypothetical protein CRV08_02095 [Halarcobacter ebronensis]|uniref:Lipocalin/cytosolic fatty-acid binding domain-containing protein n=1 Tax=Halarcobacter ebronensis TaxID=1462615 RepID=A0A4Q0YG07_9BACT|nr:lipocalin family protein [Halarcobacter ebronensis]RXJ69517.1 hypothetical protein CRV08_02095 [Halarcobacter ebronensis]